MILVVGIGIAAAAAGALAAMPGAGGTVGTADTLYTALFCSEEVQHSTAQNQYHDHSNNEVFHITYH